MPLGLAVSAVSAAALGYEIVLMRLFSIVQWHHYAAMIISLALLGIGASGSALALARRRFEARFAAALPAAAALFGVAAVAGFALAQRVPFNPLELAWDARQPAYLALVYLLLAVPFFFAGGFVGIALYHFKERAGRIYRFDLIGAGLGASGAMALLFVLSPSDCLRLVAGLGLFAAALACLDAVAGQPRRTAVLFAALAVALPLAVPASWLAPRPSPYKGLSQALRLPGAAVAAERTSPLGLVTAVESPEAPFRHAPGLSLNTTATPPEQVAVFTDGGALSPITRFDGDLGKLAYLGFQTRVLPYHLADRPAVLVLDAGGGAGVLRALYHGARRVDAVEINPQVVGLVRGRYADFAGDIYRRDDVRVHVADARAFVAGAATRYDVIALALAGGAAATRAPGANTRYTVEAIAEALGRLEPGGVLALTRPLELPPRGTLKLAATAIAALERLGVADPGRRLALIRGWDSATLVIKNGALTAADAAAVRSFCAARSFDVAYLPGMRATEANRYNILREPYLFAGMTALLGAARGEYMRAYKFHIEPATDDRPDFERFFKWRTLPELLDLRGRGGNALIEWGYLILAATLAQAAAASLLLILAPLGALPRARRGGEGARAALYFLALGLAFLFIEIAFIQRFTLFLGHPLYAVAVVLSAFLVFAGLGSGVSRRLMDRLTAERAIGAAVLGVTVVALVYQVALPPLFDTLRPAPTAAKVAAAAALVAPLAFCMGMPFPLGLARLAARAPGLIPWAWAINGCASVIGAVLAALLAVHFGFAAVVALAVVLYLVAAAVVIRPARP